jgi:ribonuclease D
MQEGNTETPVKLGRDEINALPLFHYGGRITLVRTPEELAAAVKRMSRESVLGFDTETQPCFRKGKTHAPTLVQLAGSNEVVLFHLKWQPLNQRLVSLFENPSIVKSGVAVHDDMRFLARVTPFIPRSVVDLGEIARRNNIENRGLRGLAAAFLGLRISKGEQCSNWGNRELSPRQIRYAATDAWASRAAYISMREAGLDVACDAPRPVRRNLRLSARTPGPAS